MPEAAVNREKRPKSKNRPAQTERSIITPTRLTPGIMPSLATETRTHWAAKFSSSQVAMCQVGPQALDDHGVIDGIADVVAGPGRGGGHADLQRDVDRLRHRLLARIDAYPRFGTQFFDEYDVHGAVDGSGV
jgi:hypothetical protein